MSTEPIACVTAVLVPENKVDPGSPPEPSAAKISQFTPLAKTSKKRTIELKPADVAVAAWVKGNFCAP